MSTIKTSNIQNGSSSSVNIALNTDGSATFAQMPVGPSYFAMRNKIINGAMEIDQRNAGASVTPNNSYTLDRWQGSNSQTSKYTVQQSTTAPSGFINSLLVTSSSAYTVGAAETFLLQQKIEGLNVSDLAWGSASAKTVTLSFWARSSLTGTFGGSLTNSPNDRSYPFSYSINSANTWEYKTITIAGDTSGTWLTTNGIGIIVNINLGTGATLSGTSGAWAGTTYYSSTGATSVVGTNGATFYITGVQLEVGSVATPFERRLFGQEFSLCQRYYEKSYDYATAPGAVNNFNSIDWNYVLVSSGNVSHLGATFNFKQLKRTQPTMTYYSPATGNSGVVMDVNTDRTANQYNLGQRTANVYVVTNDANGQIRAHWTANAEL